MFPSQIILSAKAAFDWYLMIITKANQIIQAYLVAQLLAPGKKILSHPQQSHWLDFSGYFLFKFSNERILADFTKIYVPAWKGVAGIVNDVLE